ncbi:hypothetical protein [Denitromonas halophila]|uniref:Zinc ribbon domain-containing protein n=1 Tax=Denitromonas halophila TaxID=1629404 RepID=A0A557QJI2_9RHOO|nr:hypothetical protein [Denitromonas halophila]TVO53064.1 hypothetical protein FHP91_14760 [Denitromonas halophila]
MTKEDRLGICGDCGGTISRRAVLCPGCGRSFGGDPRLEVNIADVRMPFSSMVVFMVKWAIAAIPAVIILAVIWFFVIGLLGSGMRH